MPEGLSSSMFRKLKDFLVRRKGGDITPAEAHKIQKASYVLNNTEVKKRFSPTYEAIVPNLDSEDPQIFNGAVWYLAKIAINKAKYKESILEILKKKSEEKRINPEFREFIKKQMQNILSKNN